MHWLRFWFTLLTLCFSFGCSIPHITVYKDPLTAEEHFKLAMTYEQEGEYEAAVREYKAASKSIAEAYYYLGNTYFTLGEYEKAEKNYKIAIRKLPQPGLALFHTGKEFEGGGVSGIASCRVSCRGRVCAVS
jgi:tetratricopeptide (TPR) repeat protein